MPQYLYQHPKTKKVIEVFQGMNEPHVFRDEKGVEWNRVWTVPQSNIDTKIDPWSESQFDEKTGRKSGTMGDLYDRSAELSEKRSSQNGGIDPIKQKVYENYKKKTGKPHMSEINEAVKKGFEL